MSNNGYAVYQKAQAEQLDQAKLILMMFAGSINFLNKAIEIADSDCTGMNKLVSKTKNVLLELMASLNLEESGEMGEILLRAYRGLFLKLNVAHIENSVDKVVEVKDSLIELEDAWKKVFRSPEYQAFKQNQGHVAKNQQVIRR